MNAKKLFLSCCVALLTLLPSAAHAEGGWVRGNWQFWNKNGNYCRAGDDCTGAYYLQNQYDAQQPLRNVQVFIEHDTVGIIGSGVSDANGNYTVQWSYTGTLPNKDKVRIWTRPWHADGRFRVNLEGGTYSKNSIPYFTIVAGTTQSAPQAVGTWCVGTCNSAGASPYYNVFWAAEAAWRRRLSTSGWFISYMTGVEIRGFADTMSGFKGFCPTSCSSNNTIQLDANAGFAPQARMMHELGHVAIATSQAWTFSGECYAKNGDDGWNWYEDEWGCGAFEEAYATFLADSTLYNSGATAPRSCFSTAYCLNDSLEASSGATCAPAEKGWPMTVQRYLWDVFDSVDDGETVAEAATNWWRMYRAYQLYPAGTSTNQADEHWNVGKTALDAKDGRATLSYRQNYIDTYALDTTGPRTINCTPP